MDDAALADEIILRLNQLCEDEGICRDIGRLCSARIPCCKVENKDHPTVQVGMISLLPGAPEIPYVGMLGILNGLVGVLPDGPSAGAGYIAAIFDAAGDLEGFRRFDHALAEGATPPAATSKGGVSAA